MAKWIKHSNASRKVASGNNNKNHSVFSTWGCLYGLVQAICTCMTTSGHIQATQNNDKVGRFIMCTNGITIPTRSLVPVTQLYVSVDASTKESLKKIDRPLFRDFWPRFVSSLEALSEKVGELCCCRKITFICISPLFHSGPEDSVPPDIG